MSLNHYQTSERIDTTYSVTFQGRMKGKHINKLKETVLKDPETRIMLIISIGQDYHENGKFRASLNTLTQLGFKKFIIVVADTLQRYSEFMDNPVEGQDESVYAGLMHKNGKAWVKRTTDDLNKFIGEGSYDIVYWDQIAPQTESGNFDRFSQLMKKYSTLYNENKKFEQKIKLSINRYLYHREQNRLREIDASSADCSTYNSTPTESSSPDSSSEDLLKLGKTTTQKIGTKAERNASKKYILEETAAFEVLYKWYLEKNIFIGYFAYPGGTISAVEYSRNNSYEIAHGNRRPFISLNLKIEETKTPVADLKIEEMKTPVAKHLENKSLDPTPIIFTPEHSEARDIHTPEHMTPPLENSSVERKSPPQNGLNPAFAKAGLFNNIGASHVHDLEQHFYINNPLISNPMMRKQYIEFLTEAFVSLSSAALSEKTHISQLKQ